MTTKTIDELYAAHQGKLVDKWALYLREYQRLLSERQNDPLSMLEIGVQNGGSLELWGQWFPLAEHIVGCDINPACGKLTFEDPRIKVVVADAGTDEAERAIAEHAEHFDIIIDDGSHRSSDIVKAFHRYFPRLKHGGIYIIEDLHCSYWQTFQGGLFDPSSSMAFVKRLADIANHEHWGVEKSRVELLGHVGEPLGVVFTEEALSEIHSLEFVNSLCIIRKAPAPQNLLGQRRIYGTVADVEPRALELRGMERLEAPDQSTNPASLIAADEELVVRKQELAEERERNGNLRREGEKEASLLEKIQADLAAELTTVAKYRSALAERDRQIISNSVSTQAMAERLGHREREFSNMVNELQRVRQRMDDAEKRLLRTKANLKRLQESVSWRMTKPLRVVTRPIREPSILLPSSNGLAGQAFNKVVKAIEPTGGFYRAGRRVRKVLREKGVLGATTRFVELATGQASLNPYTPSKKAPQGRESAEAARRRDYQAWLRQYDLMTDGRRAAMRARIETFARRPLISIVMPTYNPDPRFLSAAIDSVRAQVYPHWELCIADDASTKPQVRTILEAYEALDPRIKVCFRPRNGHISAASNSAIEMVTGEWTALLDHDDELTEHALFWVVEALNKVQGVRMIYSDEDKISETGVRASPYFKADWNEDLFRSHNMFSHLGVFETALLREVGGFRVGLEGSQDYDLVWRCLERVPRSAIHHIPRVLYSWRLHAESTSHNIDSKPYAMIAGQKAMAEHFARTGVQAEVDFEAGGFRVRYAVPQPEPLVSVIIPTRNAVNLVRQCFESIDALTTYGNYEILLVDNGSDDPDALRYFAGLGKRSNVEVIRDDQPFNYSALNNRAVQRARGEFICLLNNDIEVITPEWLSELVSVAAQPGVGAVGARLWYPNNTLQHGGLLLGVGGVANPAHKGLPRGPGQYGYFGRAILRQNFTCLTAACLVVRKSTYLQVGGLNENELKVAFNDVDFCLKLVEAGYRNVWTPYAELYHHESATRGLENTPEKLKRIEGEEAYMRGLWGPWDHWDPAYNPNLSTQDLHFGYAWPPRIDY